MTKDDQDGVDNEKIWFCLLFPLYRETTKDRFEDYTDLLDLNSRMSVVDLLVPLLLEPYQVGSREDLPE